jgi:ferredoxin
MTVEVRIESDLCNGYGNCVVAAPDVFDIDPETNIAFLVDGQPAAGQEDAVEEAEQDCPVKAIILSRVQ